jgi:uncharacterized protein YbjT (DUF2867 family)
LRECLLAPEIEAVAIVVRKPTGKRDAKLRELRHQDFFDYSTIESELRGFDACFFCVGTTSSGKDEAEYTRLTYDLTMAAATTLSRLNPQMTFVYVSGAGADSSEKGSVMWARVRGKLENALFRLPFKATYVFRPGMIQPMYGARSQTDSYRVLYTLLSPILPLMRALLPKLIVTTQSIGLAMIEVSTRGWDKKLLPSAEIAAAAERRTTKTKAA